MSREAFELWASAPPFEKSIARQGENEAWPGNYRDYSVQLAWCAWEDSEKAERGACIEDVRGIGGSFALECEEAIRARANAAGIGRS